MRLAAVATFLAVSGLAAMARAQPADDFAVCITERAAADTVRFEACTRIIAAGNRPAAELAEAFLVRGQIEGRARDFEAAIAQYDQALALQPDLLDALSFRGYAYHQLERYDLAIADREAAVRLEPDFGFRHYDLALSYLAADREADALAALDRSLALNPDDTSALFFRGSLHSARGRAAEAIVDLERLVAIDPLYARYREVLGIAYYRAWLDGGGTAENAEEAIRALRAATLLNPNRQLADTALEELTPARTPDVTGPLAFVQPAAGLRITFIEGIGQTPPEVDPMEAAIRDLIGFFATGPTDLPVPDTTRLFDRTFGAMTNGMTPITETPIAGDGRTYTLPYVFGIFAAMTPPGGPETQIVYDDALKNFWRMAPGETIAVTGEVRYTCPATPNPVAFLVGCTPGAPFAVVGATSFSATFVGWEYVVVPAGQRLAARVTFTETRQLRLGPAAISNSVDGIWWLDPEIGWWIKRDQSQDGVTQTVEALRIELPG